MKTIVHIIIKTNKELGAQIAVQEVFVYVT